MGREVMRVPLDFSFPLDHSYADAWYRKHTQKMGKCHECDDACPYWKDDLPKGEGYQLWQTVSDGPITPVFKTPEELIDYMSQPVPLAERTWWAQEAYPEDPAGKGWRREIAEKFVRGGRSAPSFVVAGGRIVSGPEAVVRGFGK